MIFDINDMQKVLTKITQIAEEGIAHNSYDELFNKLYPSIKQLAHYELMKLNPGQQLTPTALVNECYLKLKSGKNQQYDGKKHFYNTVARCMRFFLVDIVRSHHRQKRKGAHTDFSVSQVVGNDGIAMELLELDDALQQLEEINPDLANITMMRYFSGMTLDEIAKTYDCSKSHIHKQWTIARAYLVNILEEGS